ncbi:MAG: polyprenyl synthetase family protein [Eubacteriaceae bacterium]|nr:polyprenyl synthetase family protein [Eubacteriaceae bacterium]
MNDIKDLIGYIDDVIQRYMPESVYPEVIYEAMGYSLFGGGKRIRPRLMIASCELVGGDRAFIEPLFSALEMIHTYSLIHDDLPCMDDDDYRRGKPTSHRVFGEANAVLAGDALLNLAYETLFKGYLEVENKSSYNKACLILSQAAGCGGMVGGQTADLQNDETCRDEKILKFIYSNKTGALIRAGILCGALSADISAEKFDRLDNFSRCLGMLFQLTDDILDMDGENPEQGKATYAALLGKEGCLEIINKYLNQANDALEIFGQSASELKNMAMEIAVRNN